MWGGDKKCGLACTSTALSFYRFAISLEEVALHSAARIYSTLRILAFQTVFRGRP
jgi:hypothetical protein